MTKKRKSNFDTLERMLREVAELVRPPERLTVAEAAETYRKLNNPGSYVGKWDNSMAPYLIEPMETLTSLEFEGMIFAGSARSGKSDMFMNWLTHTAICDPADMMVVAMSQNVARDWSQGDLRKLFRHSPSVGERVLPGKQNMNAHDVRFKSGMRLLIKWPTITELSGKTVRYVWDMDYDRMPQDVDGEGNPFALSRKRTESFKRYGMTVAEGSPGFVIEDSKWVPKTPHEAPPTKGILSLYNMGDRRRWYWRCVHCRQPFEPDFSLMNYPKSSDLMESAEMATMRCPHCGYDHTDDDKRDIHNDYLRSCRWVREGQIWLPEGTLDGTPIRSDLASFWQKGPAALFQSFKSITLKYLQAVQAYDDTGDEGPLKTTTNVDQGMPYLPKALESSRHAEELMNRAEDWGGSREHPVVPEGARFLIATVDVQAGGNASFVVQVHGLGEGGDLWFVDMFKIKDSKRLDEHGRPHKIDPGAYLEDWDLLTEQVLDRAYPLGDGSGRMMQVKLAGCDSGGAEGVTTNAYNYWRKLRKSDEGHHRRFQLLKGMPNPSAPRYKVAYPDTSNRGDRNAGSRGDVPVGQINSNVMKDTADGLLNRIDPGGGMLHFPAWAEPWFYSQLTAEVRTPKGWENTRKKRNEAWDLLVYCLALCLDQRINLEKLNWNSPPVWATEWDRNTLVFDSAGDLPTQRQEAKKKSLAELAAELG